VAISARLVATEIVEYLDGITNVAAYLSQGPTPPVGKTVIVHPDAGQHDGPLGNPDRDLRVEFQTTCIGTTAEQALWVHDQVATRLWRSAVTLDGSTDTLPIWAIPGTEQPVRRDDNLATPLFYVTCSWLAHARPTT